MLASVALVKEHRYISYLRVSTERQGRSGLGLEAQREAVRAYLRSVGNGDPMAEYIETESGKRDDRPILAEALADCRRRRATLLIAKLDRLSRDAHFLLGLQKAAIPFVAADNPNANELMVGMLAVWAQHERKMISERTKAALAAARARGVKLGNPHLKPGTAANAAIASAVHVEQSRSRAKSLAPIIDAARAAGCASLVEIAGYLMREGHLTPRGSTTWTATGIARLLRHLAKG